MKKAFKFIGKAVGFLFDNIVTIFVIISCVIGLVTGEFVACILATIPGVLFGVFIEVKAMAKDQKEFNAIILRIENVKLGEIAKKYGYEESKKENNNGK